MRAGCERKRREFSYSARVKVIGYRLIIFTQSLEHHERKYCGSTPVSTDCESNKRKCSYSARIRIVQCNTVGH